MGKRLIPPEKGEVEEVVLREALEERYLAYALSTIMNRALQGMDRFSTIEQPQDVAPKRRIAQVIA